MPQLSVADIAAARRTALELACEDARFALGKGAEITKETIFGLADTYLGWLLKELPTPQGALAPEKQTGEAQPAHVSAQDRLMGAARLDRLRERIAVSKWGDRNILSWLDWKFKTGEEQPLMIVLGCLTEPQLEDLEKEVKRRAGIGKSK